MTVFAALRKSSAWRFARILILAYVGLLLMLLFIENRLIFLPSRSPRSTWDPPTPGGEHVEFTANDGTKLSGWYLPHPNPRAVALFACGNGGNMSYWADYFITLNQDVRLTVMGFNYRGYGGSEGSPSERGVLDDARAARKWLAQKASVPEDRIVLMGRSLGGGVAIDLAQDGCRALVVESTFTALPDVAARIYPYLPVRYVMRTRFNSLKKMANYAGPLFVSHGDADELVPYSMAEALIAASPSNQKRLFTIPGGGHNDPQPDSYFDALTTFLDEVP